jgi:hypothetical protein
MTWTTRIDPAISKQYGVDEIHQVWFAPKDYSGKGPCVGLLIPECELQTTLLNDSGVPIFFINRPHKNKNIAYWLRSACSNATQVKDCSLFLACDTAEQAEKWARRAAKLLPNHTRAALERFNDPATRARGNLA